MIFRKIARRCFVPVLLDPHAHDFSVPSRWGIRLRSLSEKRLQIAQSNVTSRSCFERALSRYTPGDFCSSRKHESVYLLENSRSRRNDKVDDFVNTDNWPIHLILSSSRSDLFIPSQMSFKLKKLQAALILFSSKKASGSAFVSQMFFLFLLYVARLANPRQVSNKGRVRVFHWVRLDNLRSVISRETLKEQTCSSASLPCRLATTRLYDSCCHDLLRRRRHRLRNSLFQLDPNRSNYEEPSLLFQSSNASSLCTSRIRQEKLRATGHAAGARFDKLSTFVFHRRAACSGKVLNA